jgi:hypothetical protein
MENILRNTNNGSPLLFIRRDLIIGTLAAVLILWVVAWIWIVVP